MSSIHSEKYLQEIFLKYLSAEHSYEIKKNDSIDKSTFLIKEDLISFIEKTQSKELQKLKDKTQNWKEEIFRAIEKYFNDGNSLIELLKNKVFLSNDCFFYVCDIPEQKKYSKQKNIFTVVEEVWNTERERIDIVVFLNGFPIFAFELKNQDKGTNATSHGENQWKSRTKTTNLFKRRGVLTVFSFDQEEVIFCANISDKNPKFFPFNKGIEKPDIQNKEKTHYLWEEILKPSNVILLIDNFISIKNDKYSSHLIFPRYHQFKCVKNLIEDINKNNNLKNYVIQHSTGSGKTLTINALTKWLTFLHKNDSLVYKKILIITDRKNIVTQLFGSFSDGEKKTHNIINLSNEKGEEKIRNSLSKESTTRIFVSTIQKFLNFAKANNYFSQDQTYALIIDEAHSSTSGELITQINKMLNNGYSANNLKKWSFFAFSATPVKSTLQQWSEEKDENNNVIPFHTYSMNQAIEEGFIIDVLEKWRTFEIKGIYINSTGENFEVEKKYAERKIEKSFQLSEERYIANVENIIDFFNKRCTDILGENAKAMIVCEEIKYVKAYEKAFYEVIKRKEIKNFKALVSYSGRKNDKSNTQIDGESMSDPNLIKKFKTDTSIKFLIVADKFQTGFDAKNIVAMFIDKKLSDIGIVQTYSRANRITFGDVKKEVFICDFKNTWDDVVAAYSQFMSNITVPSYMNKTRDLKIICSKLEAYYLYTSYEFEQYWNYSKININGTEAGKIIRNIKERFNQKSDEDKENINLLLNKYKSIYPELKFEIFPFDNDYEKQFNLIDNFLRSKDREVIDDLIVKTEQEIDMVKTVAATFKEIERPIENSEYIKDEEKLPSTNAEDSKAVHIEVVKAEIDLIIDELNEKSGVNTEVLEILNDQISKLHEQHNNKSSYDRKRIIIDGLPAIIQKIMDSQIDKDEIVKLFPIFTVADRMKKGFVNIENQEIEILIKQLINMKENLLDL